MKKRNTKMAMHRKVHAPKANTIDALHNSQPCRPEVVAEVIVSIRECYERLRLGVGAAGEWECLNNALHYGRVRAEDIDAQLVDDYHQALLAMAECWQLAQERGRYLFKAVHFAPINLALEHHEQILTHSSPLQMHRAEQEAVRRAKEEARQQRAAKEKARAT